MHVTQSRAHGPLDRLEFSRRERIWLAWTALFCAGWPVLAWSCASFQEARDWRPHAVAFIAAGTCIVRSTERRRTHSEPIRWRGPTLFVALYALTLLAGPSTLQAVAWLLALVSLVYAMRWSARDCFWTGAFLLLALPTLANLQFLFGYPLRRFVAIAAAGWLNLAGQSVSVQGALLESSGVLVAVDAPCSGIHMLWTSLLLAAVVGSVCGLDALPGTRLLVGAIGAALLANIVRTLALVEFELHAGPAALPDWAHSGIGLLTFLAAGIGIVALGTRLGRSRACVGSSPLA